MKKEKMIVIMDAAILFVLLELVGFGIVNLAISVAIAAICGVSLIVSLFRMGVLQLEIPLEATEDVAMPLDGSPEFCQELHFTQHYASNAIIKAA